MGDNFYLKVWSRNIYKVYGLKKLLMLISAKPQFPFLLPLPVYIPGVYHHALSCILHTKMIVQKLKVNR